MPPPPIALDKSGASKCANPAPPKKPNNPPVMVRITVSTKNCIIMLNGVAPTAKRIPISCVRSETEIYIMFITPIPVSYTHLTLPTTCQV